MTQPPKILCVLLDSICPANRQDVKGDFLELYQHRLEVSGKYKANIGFISDLITTLPLLWIIKKENATQKPRNMLIPNLKLARRTLLRNKLYTVINLVGLSVSLAACLLIALFVRDETSFDRQFEDYERIFRLGGNYQQSGDSRIASAATTFLLHPLIGEKVSGIESIGRVDFHFESITINDKDYLEEILYVDSTFFEIFSLPFVQGDPASALDEPSNVVIDKQTAVKFFGDANPMGKSIELKDKLFTVSGVTEDMPGNVHFEAHILFPVSGIKQFYPDWVLSNISGRSVYTYIKTHRDADPSNIESQCNTVLKDAGPVIVAFLNCFFSLFQPYTLARRCRVN